MRLLGLVPAIALALGCQGGSTEPRILAPERIGTVEMPPNTRDMVALLSDETSACVVELYENLIRCFDRSGEVVGAFGGHGAGPGEFEYIARLIGGVNGTLGVVDFSLNRFSVFRPSGTLLAELLLPGAAAGDLIPAWRFGETLVGVAITTLDLAMFETGPGSGGFMSSIEVDIEAAAIVRQEEFPAVEVECGMVFYGLPVPQGGWVFTACDGNLIFVASDAEKAVIQAPTYTGELPSDRDIADWIETERSFGRAGNADHEAALEEFRNTPKDYHLGWSEKFDEQVRFWVATERDRDEFSYLDVYLPDTGTLFGSVRVQDRVLGFDVAGSTVAVLVERAPTPNDPEGIPARAVDWYDISGWW